MSDQAKRLPRRGPPHHNADDFQTKLNQADWSGVTDSLDVESAWLEFSIFFRSILDLVAPIKQVRLKQITEPWMTSDILDNIKLRDNVFFKIM